MAHRNHRGESDDSEERARQIEGKIRKKRSDMALRVLKDEYGQEIAKRLRPGAILDALLEQEDDILHPQPE